MSALLRLAEPAARSRLAAAPRRCRLPPALVPSGIAADASRVCTPSRLFSSSGKWSSWKEFWSRTCAKGETVMDKIKKTDANIKAISGVLGFLVVTVVGTGGAVILYVEKRANAVISEKIGEERMERKDFQKLAVAGHTEFSSQTKERYNALHNLFNELSLKVNVHHEKDLIYWQQILKELNGIKAQADKIETQLSSSGSKPNTAFHCELHDDVAELQLKVDIVQKLLLDYGDSAGKQSDGPGAGAAVAGGLSLKKLLSEDSSGKVTDGASALGRVESITEEVLSEPLDSSGKETGGAGAVQRGISNQKEILSELLDLSGKETGGADAVQRGISIQKNPPSAQEVWPQKKTGQENGRTGHPPS